MRIRDDFAGPGGWSEALRMLGLSEVGIEFDEAACETARAAGHVRHCIDVRKVRDWAWAGPDGTDPLDGYIASPPCQTFSAAGSGEGRTHLKALARAAQLVADGENPEQAIAAMQDGELDERSILVLEPLVAIRDHRPCWVALEQVPQVLPIWNAYAPILRDWGYSVDTGLLQAEQFGVPQTRKRAILVAHRERPAMLPTPTHSRYYSRNRTKLDPGVEKWVSMAEALGWADCVGHMRSNYGTGGDPAARGERSLAEPAATVTSKIDRNKWRFTGAGRTACDTAGQRPRPLDEPAHTVTGKGTATWTHGGDVWSQKGCVRSVDEPAPTITSSTDNGNWRFMDVGNLDPESREVRILAMKHGPKPAIPGETVDDVQWVHERPSPTIVASFHPEVVAKPGYRKAGDPPRQKTPGSVRVSVREAGILQSFRPDYPWRGTSTKQYQQVGNAIPPLLAYAVLRGLVA